ncbi:MAG TPA: hypothetical protein VF230_12645 [Acidimicrobiales bacterium]
MKRIPIYDATAPIACTISDAEIPDRVELVERMRSNRDRLERTEHGLLLHFPSRADIEADLRQFAVDEKRCCEFWGFDVVTDAEDGDGGLALRWDGPDTAAPILDRLAAFFEGDDPLLDLAGLL